MIINMDNVFSDNTILLKLIYEEIRTIYDKDKEVPDEKFTELIKEIDDIIQNSYETDDEDIEDMEDLITACNMIMNLLFTSKENLIRYYPIIFH